MKLLHLFKNLGYSLVILLGILKSLVFVVAIYAENNSAAVESWISQAVGAPVHFKHIETAWKGVAPRLWLKAFSIGDQEVLELGDVLMGLDLPALFNWRNNLPVNVKLTGTRIQLLRESSGTTRIVGLISRAGGNLVLPAHIHLHNAQLEWKDLKHRNVELMLDNIDLHLKSRGDRSQLKIDFATQRGKLQMRANIEGDVLGTSWSADTYIRTDNFNAAELVAPYLPEQYQIEGLTMNLQAWNRWSQGHHVFTQSRLQVDPFKLKSTRDRSVWINKLKTGLIYVWEKDAWQLQLSGLELKTDDNTWPTNDLAVRMTSLEADNWQIHLGASQLPLKNLSSLFAIAPPEKEQEEILAALSPQGSWHNIRGYYATTTEGSPVWQVAADLEEFGIQPWKRLPGLNNISGHITADNSKVRLDLYSTDAGINFPRLFRTPLPVSLLRGRIDWQSMAEGGWVLKSRDLVAESPDIKTLSRLEITASPDSPLFLDIQSDFHNGQGENAGTYYPVGIMRNSLVQWLDRSIVRGKVPSGSFLLRGPLKGFPYHMSHEGHFEVLFDTEEITLDYMPEWPPLTQVNAEVRFHNNSLTIAAHEAKLYDSKVVSATAHIPSLNPTAPIEIQGNTLGPLSDQFKLLRETPLKEKFGQQVENIHASGTARLITDFAIPLKQPGDYRFKGMVSLQNNDVEMKDWDLQFSKLHGDLSIDLNGLSATAVKGSALGAPMWLDINPIENNRTQINATGRFDVDHIFEQFPSLSAIDASGDADFAIAVEIPNNPIDSKLRPHLSIYSDLKGISLDMPNPLNKKAADTQQLKIDMPLGSKDKELSVEYGKALKLAVAPEGKSGYQLGGTIDALVVNEWTNYFHRQPPGNEKGTSFITSVDFFFESIDAGLLQATDLALIAHHNDAGWFGYIDSKTVAGSFSIPGDLTANPVKLRFDHLDLMVESDDEETIPATGTGEVAQDPREMPALRIDCDQLNVNNYNLGKLLIDATKISDGLNFRDLRLGGELIDVRAQGDWRHTPRGTRSKIAGTFTTSDLGQLLASLGATSGVEGAKTSIVFDLNWPDAPFDPSREHLSGDLRFDVSAGHFLDIEPGAARVFGLFNFAALQRRLKLDFSDLFKKGFAFDFIQADFLLEEGQAYTNNMIIDGPATQIGIAGRTGLAASEFDQLVTVTPRLGAALPLASTLVGGPVAGLAVFVAQQMVTESLKKRRGIQYSVQGTWDTPIISRVKRQPAHQESADDSFLGELQRDIAPEEK